MLQGLILSRRQILPFVHNPHPPQSESELGSPSPITQPQFLQMTTTGLPTPAHSMLSGGPLLLIFIQTPPVLPTLFTPRLLTSYSAHLQVLSRPHPLTTERPCKVSFPCYTGAPNAESRRDSLLSGSGLTHL